MASCVTCRLCKETICYAPGEVWKLGYHLRTKHSQAELTHYSFLRNENDGFCLCSQKGSERKKTMYKTTVETWDCASTTLFCPRCKKTCIPFMRKQKNKVARSSFGALCLLGCWPLCFLPFMMGQGHIMNAYCKDCGLFLGTVNSKIGTFQPAQTNVFVDIPNLCCTDAATA